MYLSFINYNSKTILENTNAVSFTTYTFVYI